MLSARAARVEASLAPFGAISEANMEATERYLESGLREPAFGAAPQAARVRVVSGRVFLTMLPSSAERSDPVRFGFAAMHAAGLLGQMRELVVTHALPDVDFFVSLMDETLVCPESASGHIAPGFAPAAPVLHWNADRRCSRQVVFPSYDYVWPNQNYSGGSCWRFDAHPRPPWRERLGRAVFRGANRGAPQRAALAATLRGNCTGTGSKEDADVDCFIYDQVCAVNAPCERGAFVDAIAHHLSPTQQARFKYAIDADGVVSTLRLKNLLLSGSLVLKARSPNYQWFHADLVDGVHLVEVRSDMTNLRASIARARRADSWARGVASNGEAFAQLHLSPSAAAEYQAAVLRALAARLTYSPRAVGCEAPNRAPNPAEMQRCLAPHAQWDAAAVPTDFFPANALELRRGQCAGSLQELPDFKAATQNSQPA